MAITNITPDVSAEVAGNNTGNDAETAATALDTTTGTDSRPAPNQIAGTVWPALTGIPGGTVTTIAATAGVSKAAARRALNDLETVGCAARTRGGYEGGKRVADTWTAIPATDARDTTDAITTGTGDDEPATAEQTPTGTTSQQSICEVPDSSAYEPASGGPAGIDAGPGDDTDDGTSGGTGGGHEVSEAMEEEAVAGASAALMQLATVIDEVMAALGTGDRAAALEAAEVIYSGSAKARRLIKTAANQRPRGASGKARSHPGELRAKVAAHLAAHPGLQLTPHEVGKAIGHSPGAVSKALDKLIETGEAAMTCERPRRFTATDTTTTTAAAAAGTKATIGVPA